MNTESIGFVVVDKTEDFEFTLGIRTGDNLPSEGVLDYRDPMFLFPSRAEARAAITRTVRYEKACDPSYEKPCWTVVPAERKALEE